MVEEKQALRRVMGGIFLFAMAAGSIIGPWLVMMQWWISLSGPSIAFAFVITGLLCIPIGLVYGELTSMLPHVGGPFVFIHNAFGKQASFWGAWSLMLAYSTVIAFQLYAIGGLISYLWWPEMPHWALVIIAIALCLILYAMNSRALSLSATAQFIMFLVLVVIGFGTMIAFVTHSTFTTAHWTPFFRTGGSGFLTATALMVTMYFGFELIPQFAEESKYPVKKLWIPLIGSIVFCIVFYAGLCIVNSGMLPFDELLKMEMTSATLLKTHYGVGAQYAMAIATLLACFTCLNGFWLGSVRLLYSMGKARILPRWFDRLNQYDVPNTANLAILLIVFVFIAISGTRWLELLFTLMACGVAICYIISCMAHIRLRNKHPEWQRPWKAPGGKVMGVFAVICGAVMLFYTFKYFDLTLWVMFAIYFIGIGGPVWLFLRYEQNKYPDEYQINVPTGTVED
jgi:APA family basic amino acid/polyamine antiporter